MDKSLTQFYDELKTELNGPPVKAVAPLGPAGSGLSTPGAQAWQNQAAVQAKAVSEDVCKRIILDIYCKVIPLDTDYVVGNQAVMQGDVDRFLTNKGMTATQYLTSCKEKTEAPLLEFILRSASNAGKQFMSEAKEKLEDAQKSGVTIPPPVADSESQDTENLIVDVQKDKEYEGFLDDLKQKTINKIVQDVSKIITDKKEEKNMTFDPKTESAVEVAIDYIHKRLWKENVEMTPDRQEMVIGMAIREATLNAIDVRFKQPNSDIRPFSSQIRFGQGSVVTESVIDDFLAESYLSEGAVGDFIRMIIRKIKEFLFGKGTLRNVSVEKVGNFTLTDAIDWMKTGSGKNFDHRGFRIDSFKAAEFSFEGTKYVIIDCARNSQLIDTSQSKDLDKNKTIALATMVGGRVMKAKLVEYKTLDSKITDGLKGSGIMMIPGDQSSTESVISSFPKE